MVAIAFESDWVIGVVVLEDRSFGKGLLEHIENFLTMQAPLPRRVLVEEVSKWDDDAGVVINESLIEISKT